MVRKRDVLNLVHEMDAKWATLRVLEPEMTEAGNVDRLLITVLGIFADIELKFIRDRQRAGIDAPKEQRPPPVSSHQRHVQDGRVAEFHRDLRREYARRDDPADSAYSAAMTVDVEENEPARTAKDLPGASVIVKWLTLRGAGRTGTNDRFRPVEFIEILFKDPISQGFPCSFEELRDVWRR